MRAPLTIEQNITHSVPKRWHADSVSFEASATCLSVCQSVWLGAAAEER
jgi:hypothetical protein